jgi:hypothetical protein
MDPEEADFGAEVAISGTISAMERKGIFSFAVEIEENLSKSALAERRRENLEGTLTPSSFVGWSSGLGRAESASVNIT